MSSPGFRQLFVGAAAALALPAVAGEFAAPSTAAAAPAASASPHLPPCPLPKTTAQKNKAPKEACINTFHVVRPVIKHDDPAGDAVRRSQQQEQERTSHSQNGGQQQPHGPTIAVVPVHSEPLPPPGAPPEHVDGGTLYTAYAAARGPQAAYIRRTFIADKGNGASWDSVIRIQGNSIREEIYTNYHMQVGQGEGAVAPIKTEGHVFFSVTQNEPPRVNIDPYAGPAIAPTSQAFGTTTGERMYKAAEAAARYGLLANREFDASYTAVVPISIYSHESFANGPGSRTAIVQVNDWSGRVTRNNMTLYAKNGAEIDAYGDNIFQFGLFPKYGNFQSLTVTFGNDRIEYRPVDRALIVNGNISRQTSVPVIQLHGMTVDMNVYFKTAVAALHTSYDVFNSPVFAEYFPGLPKGARQPSSPYQGQNNPQGASSSSSAAPDRKECTPGGYRWDNTAQQLKPC